MAEADSIPADGPAASAVRALVEDARLVYEVVEKNPESGEFETRQIIKEGPTGLITTGVRSLESQMATRVLEVTHPDDAEQTRKILKSEAAIAEGQQEEPDAAEIQKFIDYQEWLDMAGEKRVVLPFAGALTALVPAAAVRIRRDFKQLISVIRTVAYLSQRHRQRMTDGQIIATLEGYRRAKSLLETTFDSIIADGITRAVRETVELVDEGTEVSEADLARTLGIAKSTIHWRVRRAIRGGWLRNLESRNGYPARLVRDSPLPEQLAALPTLEEIEAFDSSNASNPSNYNSNGAQSAGGVGQTEQPFECSSDSGGDERAHISEEVLA